MVLILIFGPAFRTAPERPERVSQISLMSAVAIEAALRQAAEAQIEPEPTPVEPEPEPEPIVPKVEPPTPVEERPKPVVPKKVDPPKPPKELPKPKPVEKKPVEQKPVEVKPKPKPKPKPKRPEIKINFNTTKAKVDPDREKREAERRARERRQEEARKQAARRQRELNQSLNSLGQNLNKRMDLNANLVGGSALGNYRLFVKQAYNRAWVEPSGGNNARAVTKVKVVVNLDGSIASAQIIGPSGHASLDRSVRDTLGRVKRIQRRPPAETSVGDRTFIINFNLNDGRITG